MEKAFFSHAIKFKDDNEHLNSENILSNVLNIERENAMKSNFSLK